MPSRRARDPAPEDAARRDLRRAHARQRGRAAGARGRRAGRRRRSPTRCSSTRSSARSTPTTRAAFQTWMQEQARGDRRLRARPQRRARQPRPVRRGRRASSSTSCNRQEGAVSQPGLQHRRGVRRADRARRPAAVADRELQPRLPGDGVARRASSSRRSSRCRRSSASPTLTLQRLAEFARRHEPAGHPAAPGGARAEPDAAGPRRARRPTSRRCSASSNPLITASRTGFPALEQVLEDARPLIAQLDPAMRQLSPIFEFLGLYKPELTAFFANTVAAHAGERHQRRPLPAHDQPAEPGEPRRLSAPDRHQPAEPVRASPATSTSSATGCPVFDNRHCGAGVPTVTNVPLPPLPPVVGDLIPPDAARPTIIQFAFAGDPSGRARAAVPPAGPLRLRRRGHAVPARQREMTLFERIVRASARRPGRVLAVVAVRRRGRVRAGAAAGAERGDGHARRPRRGHLPGDRALPRAVRRPLGDRARARRAARTLLLTSNLGRLIGLEGCLSGNKPADSEAPGGARLAVRPAGGDQAGAGGVRAGHVRERVGRRDQRPDRGPPRREGGRGRAGGDGRRGASRSAQGRSPRASRRSWRDSARQLVYAQFLRDLLQINLRVRPRADRPAERQTTRTSSPRCSSIPSRGATTPKARFAYMLPSPRSALIQVRLKPELSDAQRAEAVALVREAVRMPEWRLKGGATYTVTGAPVVGGGPRGRARGLDAAAAAGRRAGDGARAGAGVPQPAAAACRWPSRWRRWRSRSGRWRCWARR